MSGVLGRIRAALFPPAPELPPEPAVPVLTVGTDPLLPLAAMLPADRRRALLRGVVNPVLAVMAAKQGIPATDAARVLLLAIAGQEGGCGARRQANNGPARGLWQFERGGGVAGVLAHRATALSAAEWAAWRKVAPDSASVWSLLAEDDHLACAFARLLLWSDPKSLPTEMDAAWALYLRTWRPGKPHVERWPENWRLARAAVAAS